MNYLAHVFLAPDSPEARIGSVPGNFRKGFAINTLPPEIGRGVQHHLTVDAYTDSHPQIVASRRPFSSQRIRFSNRFKGIIEEIHDHDAELELRFLEFFTDLQRAAKQFW